MISVSSFKPGFGSEQLSRDDGYWQSDGPQPHQIHFHFVKRTKCVKVSVQLDYKQDESYTPSKIAIRANNVDLVVKELVEPTGWVLFEFDPIWTFELVLVVVQNHQNGKDTHIRQVKVN
jgi:anaphase-promoting complex subunit 10